MSKLKTIFKLRPDKEEKITDILSNTYLSDQIGFMLIFP